MIDLVIVLLSCYTIAFTTSYLIRKFYHVRNKALNMMLSKMINKRMIIAMYISLCCFSALEEIIFRYIPYIIGSLFSDNIALILLIIASCCWGLLHYLNYDVPEKYKDKVYSILLIGYIIPMTFLFIYVFLKYGIIMCIIIHCILNTISLTIARYLQKYKILTI